MFANSKTLEVLNRSQLQALFPDTSFPPEITTDNIADLGYVVLEYDAVPNLGLGERAEAGAIRRSKKRVIQGWKVVPPTESELTSIFEQAVQTWLDAAAVAAGYDSLATAISYAEEPAVPKFQNGGKAFRAWRSLVWAYAREQMAAVKAGEREQPTTEAFLQELPVLEMPA